MTAWTSLPTELVTARLVLDQWREADLPAYIAMVGERDARGPNRQLTDDELRNRLDNQRRAIAETGIGVLAVRLGGSFIGYCGLVAGRMSLDEPEIAFELLRAHHGDGYATEAARAVVDAAAATGRRRLWATVRTWNGASLRVLDKLGFERTDRRMTDEFGEVVWLTRSLDRVPAGPHARTVRA
jgi:RimJ/RimL family protein N-acetyltransferase